MYQQITLIGHLGKDPESRQTQSGKQYTTVSLAVSRQVGQGQKETTWFSVTAWENKGSYLATYAQKGSLVMVTGRLVPDQSGGPRTWVDANGNARASFEVVAQDVKILAGFRSADDRTAAPQPVSTRQATPRKTAGDRDREDNQDFEY